MNARFAPLLLIALLLLATHPVLADAPFGPEIEIVDLAGANSVSVGALAGAGGVDIFAGAESSSTLVVAIQEAGGTWSEISLSPGSGSRAVELADLDGDGDLDLVYTDFGGGKLYWRSNDLDVSGTFLPRQEVADADGAQGIFIIDLDGDGDGDGNPDLDILLAARTADAYYWIENVNGDGSSWTQHLIQGDINAAQAVWGGDVDGDGDVDVVGGSSSGSGKLSWYENSEGDGSVWIEHDIFAGNITAVIGADLDHDGDLDLLVQEQGAVPEIRWWENTAGDGTAWTVHTIATVSSTGRGLQAVDLDFDGDLDVVGSRDGDWYENVNGDASVWIARALSAGGILNDLQDTAAVDVDGDGDIDIVAARSGQGVVSWWPNLTCSPGDPDPDGDGFFGACDRCEGFDDNDDTDGDGVPDGCDICPLGDDNVDSNDNGVPDACEGVRIDDVTVDEGDTGTTPLTFTITLGGDTDPFTIGYSLADDTATVHDDYAATSGTIDFAGDDGETHALTVFGFGDTMVEDDETFVVNLTVESGTVDLADSVGVGTLLNDDLTTVAIDDISLAEGDSGTTAFTFTLTLSAEVQDGVEVDYATQAITATEGSDYFGHSGSVSFTGHAFEQQAVTVLVKGDVTPEDDEVFHLELTSGKAAVITDDTGVGTILDDDSATVAIDDVAMAEGDAGTTDFVFTVSLTGAVQDAFDIGYRTVDQTATAGSDYTATSGSISLGDGSSSDTITVVVHGDTLGESDERFVVELLGPLPEGVTFTDSLGDGVILDDDIVLTLTVDGTGHIGSSPAGIDCGNGGVDCEELYALGTVVEFDATPETGWVFAGFTGDADCDDGSVTMTGATDCRAAFVLDQGTLEVSFEGSGLGLVTSDPEGIACDRDGDPSDCTAAFETGTEVSLGVSITDPDSSFGGWTGDADCADAVVTITAGETVHCVAVVDATPLFADGFESGDTSGWSTSVP